jgi:superfamily II DNA or RNA helicase
MGIDDIADELTDVKSPRDKIESQYLEENNSDQWVERLNDMIVNIMYDKISINDKDERGDIKITENDIDNEIGPLYKNGISAYVDREFEDQWEDEDIGVLARELNRIRKMKQEEDKLENMTMEEILTSATRKAVTEEIRISNRDYRTPTEVIQEILVSPTSEAQAIDKLIDKLQQDRSSILEFLDKPQMVTELWDHQKDALNEWIENEMSGYVQMATATGKTVLGLAAISAKYGSLSPSDEIEMEIPSKSSQNAQILVITHDKTIAKQWKEELINHMAIPETRAEAVDDLIDLSWGKIHFERPSSVERVERYDLVVMDEMHHFIRQGQSSWFDIFEEAGETDMLAMTGSLEPDNKTKADSASECIFKYDEKDAMEDGIICDFTFNIVISPMSDKSISNLDQVSSFCINKRDKYESMLSKDYGHLNYNFSMFPDIINFADTSDGKSLKEESDNEFARFARQLRSRRAKLLNAVPSPNHISKIAKNKSKKTVITVNSYKQVNQVVDNLSNTERPVFKISKNDSTDDKYGTVKNFNKSNKNAIIVGTGKTIGEGIDMEDAEVCINYSRGSVNNSLIQRIGRVLRNPEGKEKAEFYNILDHPRGDALISDQDGVRLGKRFSEYDSLMNRYDLVDNPTVMIGDGMEDVVEKSRSQAQSLVTGDKYDKGVSRALEIDSIHNYFKRANKQDKQEKNINTSGDIQATIDITGDIERYISTEIEKKVSQRIGGTEDSNSTEDKKVRDIVRDELDNHSSDIRKQVKYELEEDIEDMFESKIDKYIEKQISEKVSKKLEEKMRSHLERILKDEIGISEIDNILTEDDFKRM